MSPLYAGASSTLTAGESRLLHLGRGSLLAVLASHAESSPQTVTLYDNDAPGGDILLRLKLAAGVGPCYVQFPAHCPLRFSKGLAVDPAGCEVTVIAAGGGAS